MSHQIRLRPATPADLAAVQAIYAPEVREGTASFELVPPDRAELGARLARIQGLGLPWLVAEDQGDGLAGFGYAGPYRERPAYRFTVESSVYVARRARGLGIGRRLLEGLMEQARIAGARQMVAVIGDSANAGSIRLHEACGFRHAGTLEQVGFKFGRWLDTVLMQRSL